MPGQHTPCVRRLLRLCSHHVLHCLLLGFQHIHRGMSYISTPHTRTVLGNCYDGNLEADATMWTPWLLTGSAGPVSPISTPTRLLQSATLHPLEFSPTWAWHVIQLLCSHTPCAVKLQLQHPHHAKEASILFPPDTYASKCARRKHQRKTAGCPPVPMRWYRCYYCNVNLKVRLT